MSASISSVCVFCGSAAGARPEYREAAVTLGELLAARGIRLIYGGSCLGLMGVIADTVLARCGQVTGVMPQLLVAKEAAHRTLPDLRIVNSMHERKALMADLADAFIAMPGGCGTFEEFFEILTWAQLGVHSKPMALLNVAGFYDPLLALLDHAVAERFVKPANRDLVLSGADPAELLNAMLGRPGRA